MSMLGGLTAAISGGAGAVNEIAGNDVKNQQRLDLERARSAIEEARQQRLEELRSQLGMKQDAYRADLGRKTEAGRRQDEYEFNTRPDVVNQRRSIAAGDASAAAEAERKRTKEAAADAGYLQAKTKIELADPKVAAQIAQMRAAANASNAAAGNSAAHAELVRTQTAGVKQDLEANRKLNSIYDQMDQVNADPKLTPEQRAEKLSTLERRAQSMQGVGRAKSGEKPDSIETQEVVEYDESGKPLSKKVTTTKKGADRGQSQPSAPYEDGTELQGKDGKRYVVRDGKPVLKDDAPSKKPTMLSSPVSRGPEYKTMDDGRIVDVTTGRTLTQEQVDVLKKLKNGEPTTPRDRALLGS